MAKTIHRPEYAVLRSALRDLRIRHGVTQVQLAADLGRSQAFVSEIERGSRRLDVLELFDICQVLGVSPAQFLKELESTPNFWSRSSRKKSHRDHKKG